MLCGDVQNSLGLSLIKDCHKVFVVTTLRWLCFILFGSSWEIKNAVALYISWNVWLQYSATVDIRCTLVGNKIVDYTCCWSTACRRCFNYIFIHDLTPGFNGLGKDNCKKRWETFRFWDLVWLILEVWQYIYANHYWLLDFTFLSNLYSG